MYRTTILSAAPVVGALLATSPTAQASLIGYTFTEIEVPGSIDMSPDAINNLGQIVGTYTDDAGNGHGFLEKGGKYVNVDVAGALFTAPAGINDLVVRIKRLRPSTFGQAIEMIHAVKDSSV
jgi:probable HAF family extracellular repeat protein